MAPRHAGRIKRANGGFPLGDRSAFISIEPRKLAAPVRKNPGQLGVPLERFRMKHLVNGLDVDRSNRVAFYTIKKPAQQADLPSSKRRPAARIRQHAGYCIPPKRAHPIEVHLRFSNGLRAIQQSLIGIRARKPEGYLFGLD